MDKITEDSSLVFLKRVFSSIDKTDDHWIWKGALHRNGYGAISFLAHRLVYELLVGRIPDGLVIDHICRKRNCVNPAHLRVVTLAQNNECGMSPAAKNARKKRCVHGHPFTAHNIAWHKKPDGRWGRDCKKCVQRRNREQREKQRIKNVHLSIAVA